MNTLNFIYQLKFRKMSIARFSLIMTVLASIAAGCSSGNSGSPFVFGKGKYSFVMYDSTGNKKILEGTMTVSSYTGGNASGTLEYTKVYDSTFAGYSSMSREFQGTYDNVSKKLWINTNPKIADSNVFWNARAGSGSINGEWNYSMFRGTGSKGKLKIKPVK